MKKLNIFWPSVIAIAVAVSLVSYHNNKMIENSKKRINIDFSKYKLSEIIEPAKGLDDYKLESIVTVDEYLRQIEAEKEQENKKTR